MKLKPLHDNVVVKPLNTQEMTKSGIVLPETASKEKPERGEIIAIGPGKTLENGKVNPLNVKIGDKVVFKKYSPDEVKVADEKFLIISESDILAIIA